MSSSTLGYRRQRHALLILYTVYLTHELTIDKHLCIVVGIADGQQTGLADGRQRRRVERRAPPHVHIFEGLRVVAGHRASDELS